MITFQGHFWVGLECVFFMQHSGEKCLRALWEGRFFVAPRASFANVTDATEGASPCRAFRFDGSHQAAGLNSQGQSRGVKSFTG